MHDQVIEDLEFKKFLYQTHIEEQMERKPVEQVANIPAISKEEVESEVIKNYKKFETV